MDKGFLESLGLHVSEAQRKELQSFLDALYTFNESKNLTRVPREASWIRHIIDSVLFQDAFPQGSRVLDIGCGPGLPAWPLACLRPDLNVVGLDANAKMIEFLQSSPLKNLQTWLGRAEEVVSEKGRSGFDVVTGRAVAPLAIQLELSAPFVKLGCLFAPMRTPNDLEEAQRLDGALGLELVDLLQRDLPETAGSRLMPVYVKRKALPRGYPRHYSAIKKKPL